MQRKSLWTAIAMAAFFTPLASHAQTAVVGSLGNFDAGNHEGKDAYGFEIEIHGIQSQDLSPSWCGNKFGCPQVEDFPGGVYVRYKSPYDAVNRRFTAATVPIAPGINFGGTCYTWVATYARSGCDHFGVHVNYAAAARAVTAGYRWMFEDAANPGQLVASERNIFVPTPVYTVIAPAQPALPPVLQVEIEAPPPPRAQLYGDATWVKTFKRKLEREVRLEELLTGNPVVPQTAAEVETEWELMQAGPPSDGRQRQRNKSVHADELVAGVRAVVRRYETYAYTGAYDPVTHAALCVDLTCTAPSEGELGDLQATQMVAANVANPSLNVVVAGGGRVSSTDRVIACGSKCSGVYPLGSVVTLVAEADSKTAFRGWTGACTGTALTCDVTIADAMNVTATFEAPAASTGGGGTTTGGGTATGAGSGATFVLKVDFSKTGTVTAVPKGTDRAIDCGGTCAAKFPSGTAVTLTATPAAGKSFLGWSGACTGTAAQCTVTMNGDRSVTPSFSR